MISPGTVLSPMAVGNGAYVVHKAIESLIPGYRVVPYHPYRTFFPPSLFLPGRFSRAGLIHTAPDYAIFHGHHRVPLVLTFHNYVLDRLMRPYSSSLQYFHYQTDLKFFTRLAVERADLITAVSRFTADLVKRDLRLADDVRVIYNGVDAALFVPSRWLSGKMADKIQVLFCGNLTRRKGAQWLVPILDKLDRNIVIAYTSGLRSSSLPVTHARLQCLGAVPHEKMPEVYRTADILLFPTVREGFGLVAAEAMACGLPVVASNCSSLPELIDDGRGGFLCPVGDVEAFAGKIRLLAENPHLRREMGEYNRAKVEELFTLNRMVDEYQRLFEEVLSR